MIRILIVDDHNLFREGLGTIIQQESDIEVVGMAGTVQEAVDTACTLKPDLVLMDFTLPDGTGADATRQIIQEFPNCKIVFMTMSERDEDLLAAIRSGAVGYLLKNMTPSKTKDPEPLGDPALGKLTAREKDVLNELAAGKSNQEIARELVISENTVKYHVHSILDKLNLRDRKEAAQFAKEHGVNNSA